MCILYIIRLYQNFPGMNIKYENVRFIGLCALIQHKNYIRFFQFRQLIQR